MNLQARTTLCCSQAVLQQQEAMGHCLLSQKSVRVHTTGTVSVNLGPSGLGPELDPSLGPNTLMADPTELCTE